MVQYIILHIVVLFCLIGMHHFLKNGVKNANHRSLIIIIYSIALIYLGRSYN